MVNFLNGVKRALFAVGRWFKNHAPTRRRIIQLYAALLTNANIKGFATGTIYKGATKNLCTPGLNCYSCPGAVAACPLGALQNSLGSSGTTTPYYILGILALLGLSLGRTICGFLCPFGLVQELVYKVKTPKLKKSRYTRILSYLKYILLGALVIAVPLIYNNVPGFCKYICPAGTFEGSVGLLSSSNNADFYSMLGYLFSWKFVLFITCIVACVFIYRAFCRFICPLGAIYGFFNKISLLGVKLEKSKCVECGLCVSNCKMDIKRVGDHECINCGECIKVCPTKAISWKGSKIFVAQTSSEIVAAEAPAPAISAILSSGTTTIAAPVEVAPEKVEPVTNQEIQPEVEYKAVERKFKKRALIAEITAWVLAVAVLVSALVYYNVYAPTPANGASITAPEVTFEVYDTAYEGDDYSFYDKLEKTTIVTFWSTRNEASIEFVSEILTSYESLTESSNLLIVHINNNDNAETVQSVINENGWNLSPVPFAQDNEEDFYSAVGGEGAFPTTVFVDVHGGVHNKVQRPMETSEILSNVNTVNTTIVYKIGDKLPKITLNAYRSAYKEPTYCTESALGKVLVINFWYVTCGPCVEELPYIEEVKEEYGDSIEILAIHSDNDDVPQPFIDSENKDRNKVSWSDWEIIFARDIYSSYFAESLIYSQLGGRAAYPMTIVVNAEGYITYRCQGPVINASIDKLRPAIDEALANN